MLRKIAAAERKARQLEVCPPYNPVLEMGENTSDYERQQWAAWVSQKPVRRSIGKLATAPGLIHHHTPSAIVHRPRKLYEAFSSLTGQIVTIYGDLRTTSRSEKPIEAEYPKHLYLYGGGAFQSKPYIRREWQIDEHIREERLKYCQRMRDWRDVHETVNWLRSQIVSLENVKEEEIELDRRGTAAAELETICRSPRNSSEGP